MHRGIKYIVLSLCLFSGIGIMAQSGDNSPFSRFGIGDIVDQNFMHSRAMGSLGSSYIDLYTLNIKNPASYSYLKSTAFEVGLYAKYSQLSDDQNNVNIWSGNLEYISLGFPLRNPINEIIDRIEKDYSFGMNLTLMPFSLVNYNITSTEVDPNFGEFQRNYQGKGGSYQLMWGNSFKYKDFSIGFNAGYLFGNIRYEQNIYFNYLSFTYENRYNSNYGINGFIWNAGVMYTVLLNEKAVEQNKSIPAKRINFGVQGNTDMRFFTNGSELKRGIFVEASISDTLSFEDEIIGEGTLPAELGFGAIYYHGTAWALGFDVNQVFWSRYKNEARPETLSNGYRLSIGGHIIPDARAFNQYFKRVKYRFGAFYQNDPREIDNSNFASIGFNVGAGFPLMFQRKYRAQMNPVFQFGIKGIGSSVKETYVRLGFGFTFNDDEWFLKRKYN